MKQLVMSLTLLALLSACVPVATLRDPRAASDTVFTFGGSVLGGNNGSSNTGVFAFPYFGVATGNGRTEFNLSAQLGGGRLGLKQELIPNISLDFGVTVPLYLALVGNLTGVPLAVDVGVIGGLGPVYLSPRVIWVGYQDSQSNFSGALGQFSIGYSANPFIVELSAIGDGSGGLIALSGGFRF